MEKIGEKSLFERIGGWETVNKAVNKLYIQMTVDPLLSPFFPPEKLELIKHHQKDFLTLAFGGSSHYTGRNLRAAHAHLIKDGLSDIHFDAVVHYLVETLKQMEISDELIKEVCLTIEPYRNDVLGR